MQGWIRFRRQRIRDDEWKYWYASELLDDDTCPECRTIDGKQYPRYQDAMLDYEPQGGNKHCTSPDGCRGTLVGVSVNETDPTQ